MQSHSGGSSDDGHVLRISSQGIQWMYWVLVTLFLASSAFAAVGRIDEYATGMAVIKDEGRAIVTAVAGGAVRRVVVQPGQHVDAGQPLVYLHDLQEQIEVERLQKELDAQQINRLRNPNDAAAHQQVAILRTQIGAAEARLHERTLRAPRPGSVQDIRVRLNQLVNAGDWLLSIVGERDALTVVAILPGRYRPLLANGTPLHLELAGFRHVYQRVTIDEIGHDVIGPSEIRRVLGPEIADSLALEGSSVIVRAHLSARTFEAGGRRHDYHDGMHATAEVRVRSEPIVVALIPGLKGLFGEQP